jgi:hypothetical protein
VPSVLRPGLLEKAAASGLRSCSSVRDTRRRESASSAQYQNLGHDSCAAAVHRLHDLVSWSMPAVFGMDDDDETVFERTVAGH